ESRNDIGRASTWLRLRAGCRRRTRRGDSLSFRARGAGRGRASWRRGGSGGARPRGRATGSSTSFLVVEELLRALQVFLLAGAVGLRDGAFDVRHGEEGLLGAQERGAPAQLPRGGAHGFDAFGQLLLGRGVLGRGVGGV